jgi:hypothetical protein
VITVGSTGGLTSGILCLTDDRLLFVRERSIGKPIVLSIPMGHIEDVVIDATPLSGILTVTSEGRETRFEVTPKTKTWNLFWPIKEYTEGHTPEKPS